MTTTADLDLDLDLETEKFFEVLEWSVSHDDVTDGSSAAAPRSSRESFTLPAAARDDVTSLSRKRVSHDADLDDVDGGPVTTKKSLHSSQVRRPESKIASVASVRHISGLRPAAMTVMASCVVSSRLPVNVVDRQLRVARIASFEDTLDSGTTVPLAPPSTRVISAAAVSNGDAESKTLSVTHQSLLSEEDTKKMALMLRDAGDDVYRKYGREIRLNVTKLLLSVTYDTFSEVVTKTVGSDPGVNQLALYFTLTKQVLSAVAKPDVRSTVTSWAKTYYKEHFASWVASNDGLETCVQSVATVRQ